MNIKTDNKWKPIVSGYELTEKEKAEFDYMDADEIDGNSFFRYYNKVYSLSDFMRFENLHTDDFKDWHGYSSDTYFSGIVIKLSDCGEAVKAGRYIS